MRSSVCLLTNAYPDFPDSNRVVFIRHLAHLLSRQGWKVSVVVPRVFSKSKRIEREGAIEIRRFSSFLNNRLLVEYSRTPVFRLSGYMLAGLIATVSCVWKQRCDLIHAHWAIPAGLIALLAGGICRKPVVVTTHGSDILVTPRNNPLIRRLVRLVLKRADAVTSVAEHLTSEIVDMGIPRERIVTFPMSVVTESFGVDGPAIEDPGAEHVVFSNRSLYPVYSVESLVRAVPMILEKTPEARVLIAGEGPEAGRLAALARELDVTGRIEFLGAVAHEQMPKYLRAASVYVSTALSDGASVSLLEAMACGTFPVVADIPANREWIEDGENGFLFPPGDARVLARKIEQGLMREPLRRKARETNIRLIEERAKWSSNVEKLLGLYETVMSRSRAKSQGKG